MKTTLTQSS